MTTAGTGWRRDDGIVDEIAVERAVMGDPPARMTLTERCEAVAQLAQWGYSASEIAARLRVDQRSVERYRAHQRALA